jgi:BolA family transcriptional regulator, general stress-responsive regulator
MRIMADFDAGADRSTRPARSGTSAAFHCPMEMLVSDRISRLRVRLEQALSPDSIEIVDDSHKHVGHAGARDGRGHFSVRVVGACFRGRAPLARHRLIYAAVGDLMDTDIHALSIQALTPEEVA